MRKRIWLLAPVVIIGTVFLILTLFTFKAKNSNSVERQTLSLQNFDLLSIVFEPNWGQAEKDVNFVHNGKNYSLSLKSTESVFLFNIPTRIDTSNGNKHSKSPKNHQREFIQSKKTELSLKLLNSNPTSKISAKNPLKGRSNYLFGNNPDKWLKDIPHYGKIKCEDVYSGIDLEYYGKGSQLEYDFIVTPGSDPDQIKFEIAGAEDIRINAVGDLIIAVNEGSLIMKSPDIYQNIDGTKEPVSGRYVVNQDKEVSFKIDDYALNRTLIIDPVLVYSTYLGGNSVDGGFGIDTDSDGNIYVTGASASSQFAGKQKPVGSGDYNVFVLKLDPSANSIIYVSFFGGSARDIVNALDVDNAGHVYVAGQTSSDDYPIAYAWQDHNKGGWIGDGENHYDDAFVTKLNPEGNGFIYSTYLGSQLQDEGPGGNPTYGCDEATGIAADVSGNAYVVGWTNSVHFYTTDNAYQKESGAWANRHRNDVFLTKFDPTGGVVYSTYFGGVIKYEDGSIEKDLWADDEATGIAIDELGNMYVTGFTDADSLPTTPGAFQTQEGSSWIHCFITKFNPPGTDLVFSTLLAGNYSDYSESICIDKDRNIYITGLTSSDDFPTANPFQPPLVGASDWDAFMAKISADGSALLYSTYWGSSGTNDISRAIAVDDLGFVYITGYTNSPNLVIKNGLPNPYGGNNDVFVTKFDPFKTGDASLVYSTYLGGSADEYGNAITVDHNYNALVTGSTNSDNFPFTDDALQDAIEGTEFSPGVLYSDAFISKIGKQSDFDILPDGVAYDVLHWDADVGALQSSFPTVEITGTGLGEVESVVFKLPDDTDDPYMITSNIQASDNKVEFDLAVTHTAFLGEREIILKVKNKPDINATDKIGRKFIVTRIKSFFNQAVNASVLQTHAHRDILIAEKKGAQRIQLYDESQFGKIFHGKLSIVGTKVDSISRKAYPYQKDYTPQEIVEGRDYLSIPFPENLDEGVHEFFSFMIRDDDNLVFSCPLIKRKFVKTEPFDITGARFNVHSPSGKILQPPTDAKIKETVRFIQRLYPLSSNQLSYVEYVTTDLYSSSTHPNRPLATDIKESVMYNGKRVTHLTEKGRNRLVAAMYKMHKRVLKEFNNRSNVLVVFLPDSMLFEDGNNDGVINPAQPGSKDYTTAGEVYEARSVILVGTSSRLGGTLSHEIGHLVQSSSYVYSLMRGEGNLGDEYEGGLFYCDVNPPVKGLKDWDNQQPCTDSPLVNGIHGNSTGTFAPLSAFDPVDMIPKFYYQDITPLFRHFNFMSKAVGDEHTWVTVSVYDKLMKIFIPELSSAGFPTASKLLSNQLIEIPGIIYDNDTAMFNDLNLLESGNTTPSSSGPYSIELQDGLGATLSSHSFDVEFVKVSEPPVRTDHSLFNIRMERLTGGKQVVLKKDGVELAAQTLSDNPPVVQITEPQDGALVKSEIDLRWTANDLDNDSLSYTIYFSLKPDEMIPINVSLKEMSLHLDISTLPAPATAYITVVASDGLNEGSDSVTVQITEPVSVQGDHSVQPAEIRLHQNYPNPFNPETRIQYDLTSSTHVRVAIFNMLGQQIRTLVDELKPAGSYTVLWDGRKDDGEAASSGVYLYRLQTEQFKQSRKLLLMR